MAWPPTPLWDPVCPGGSGGPHPGPDLGLPAPSAAHLPPLTPGFRVRPPPAPSWPGCQRANGGVSRGRTAGFNGLCVRRCQLVSGEHCRQHPPSCRPYLCENTPADLGVHPSALQSPGSNRGHTRPKCRLLQPTFLPANLTAFVSRRYLMNFKGEGHISHTQRVK